MKTFSLILFFIVSSFLSFAQVNLNQGLVAYYPFNGNANDVSGNGNNPTFNNATLTSDRNGNLNSAYHFNGVDNYMKIPNSPTLNTNSSISVCAWVRPTGFYHGKCHGNRVLMKGDADFLSGNYLLNFDDNAYTGGMNCTNSVADTIHQTAYGVCGGNTYTYIQKNEWILLTYTYDGTTCRFYINCKLEGVETISNLTFTNAYDLFLGKMNNSQYPYWFNGDLDEVRIYNRALNYQEVLAINGLDKSEFSLSQNICNPKQLIFKNESIIYTKFYWNFGNGVIDSTNTQPTITYNTWGNYNVQLITKNSFGCYDTTVKTIPVTTNSDTTLIINNKDTSICLGQSFTLKIKDTGLDYCWSSSNNSVNGKNYNPTVSPTSNTTYYLNTQKQGTNLVVNGDFESGNTGFSSDYIYEPPPNTMGGTYYTGTNPNAWNMGMDACPDHTSGTGKMLLINGSSTLNTSIWKETINILPNVNYAFSVWVQSIHAANPAQLKFSINGIQVGTLLYAPSTTCSWQQFYVVWNSGNRTKAEISIVNQNTALNGNDFAFDDISFAPVQIISDSIKVTVNNCLVDPCKSWLKTPSTISYVECGDLDITGDKLTIEAKFNNPSSINSANFHGGKIVSKHTNQSNCNYSLMDYTCEITTQNSGYVSTPPVCLPVLDKQYHVAMVYDGSVLKFYRNGILMSQIAASGNLIQNNLLTAISQGSGASAGSLSQYFGLVNEVRIWNTARTQQQLQQYMNDTLSNPATQVGLKAYYTFNSLKNKQGNSAYDGTIIGSATINETNPQCNLIVDSCGIIPSPPANPNCKGIMQLTKTSKVTPPQTNYKKYFPATGFTWECWFNSTYYNNSSTQSDTRCKILSATDDPQCQDIVLGFGWPQVAQKNELCFVVDGPNGCGDRDNTPCKYFPAGGFSPNTWYHVAAVRDYANNVSSLYVNGVLVDTKTNTHQPLNPNKNLLFPNFEIGSWSGLVDSAFAGKLDEIRIWNYPRSATQVQSNYNKCLDGNENGLVAYYHSNEGKGTTLKDASPNANNATLSSSVTWDKTDNAPLISTCYTSTFDSTHKEICYGDSLRGHKLTGIYRDTSINSYGCDSISVLNLKVLSAPSVFKDTIRGCGQVIISGNTYTANTVISTTIKNKLGCDSIVQQHEIIITTKRDTITKQICSGQTFWGHTTSFDTTFKLANNCDSILHVNIKNDVFTKDSITKSICNGEVYFGYNITGYYTDTFHTASCDSIRVLHLIKSDNLQPKLQQDTSICDGDLVNLYPGSYQKYLWSTGSISASIKVKDIGVYWVEVSDSIGCKARDSFTLINIYAKPANFLPTTLQVCYGELYTINGYKNYNWITGATTPSINLNGLNSYWLQVTDDNDCKGIDTMKIIYLSSQSINVINAFSPNGDGINDEFKPFTSNCLIQYELLIFNRWGQKVFSTTNVNRGWNGLLNGKPLPTDVYYYIIKYKTVTGLGETKSGYITLLR